MAANPGTASRTRLAPGPRHPCWVLCTPADRTATVSEFPSAETTLMTVLTPPRLRLAALLLARPRVLAAPRRRWCRPGAAQPAGHTQAGAPGASEGSGDRGDDASERACQRYAEQQGLDVRRIRDTRQSGKNNVEVTLSVQDRHGRYDARCIYDADDQEVRELTPLNTGDSADRDSEVDERLATRAQNACEQLAEDRNLKDVDLGAPQARGRDTIEIGLRARLHGERQNLSCLYDDEQRHAVLAE